MSTTALFNDNDDQTTTGTSNLHATTLCCYSDFKVIMGRDQADTFQAVLDLKVSRAVIREHDLKNIYHIIVIIQHIYIYKYMKREKK